MATPRPDWSCSACTFMNAASKSKCQVCGADRPKLNTGPVLLRVVCAKSVFPLQVEGTTTFGFLKDLLENQTGVDFEEQLLFCDAPVAPLDAAGSTKMAQLNHLHNSALDTLIVLSAATAPMLSVRAWQCPSCTFVNERSLCKCAACQTPRTDKDVLHALEELNIRAVESAESAAPAPSPSPVAGLAPPEMGRGVSSESGFGTDEDVGWSDEEVDDGAASAAPGVAAPGGLDPSMPEIEALRNKMRRRDTVVLSSTQTQMLYDDELARLQELLGLSPGETSLVVRHFKWQTDALTQAWFSSPEKVLLESGLRVPDDARGSASSECQLCFDGPLDSSNSTALACEHTFCDDCWRGWLRAELEKGTTSIATRCPAYKCTALVPIEVQEKYVGFRERDKLRRWLLQDFVSSFRGLKWCPGPGCMNAGYCQTGSHVINCVCDFSWCFACQRLDHRPVLCAHAAAWLDKCTSESENVTWIRANTKVCPNCKVHIEKNQGCQHMTCRHCKHEFCWLCKGNWRGHSACNRFGDAEKEQREAAVAKSELERYMHFFSRYETHEKSLEFARKTLAAVQTRMVHVADMHSSSSFDTEFIKDAVEAVIMCHRTLQWTYVFGFYLRKPQSDGLRQLFEMQQERLESFTDSLHELAEQSDATLADPKVRSQMINYTGIVQKYRQNVISAIEDGYLHDDSLRSPDEE